MSPLGSRSIVLGRTIDASFPTPGQAGRPGLIACMEQTRYQSPTHHPNPEDRQLLPWVSVGIAGGVRSRAASAGQNSGGEDRGPGGAGRDRGRIDPRRHQQEEGENPLMARRALAYGATIVNTPLDPFRSPAQGHPGACRRARHPRPRVFPRQDLNSPRSKPNGEKQFPEAIFDRQQPDGGSSEIKMIG